MHSNWRDCDAWRKSNLPMNTLSNEAAKLYDITLSQLMRWREDQQYGGLLNSLNKMINADPDFILGQCLKTGVELMGSSLNHNSQKSYEKVKNLVRKAIDMDSQLTKREKLHVKAVEMMQYGNLPMAAEYLEQILIDSPNDCQAIKLLHSLYFYLGESKQMHQSLARIIPRWSSQEPHYSYLYSLYGFGLAQDNYLDKAEKNALRALEMNRNDAWAIHAISHVNEYRSSYDRGIKFLHDTELDWNQCDMIASHNYWHMSLYYVEKNDCESALEVLDSKIMTNLDSVLNLINASSLLLRLKINNYEPKNDSLAEKWQKVKDKCMDKIEHQGYMYSSSHYAMALATCGTSKEKASFLNNVNEYLNSTDLSDLDQNFMYYKPSDDLIGDFKFELRDNFNYLKNTNQECKGLFESIFSYQQNVFDRVVDLLYPIRYKIKSIGGSNAQRDVFNLILIDAAFKSNVREHNLLAISLLNERLLTLPDSDFTKRLAMRFLTNE
jgi:hypothetical protein